MTKASSNSLVAVVLVGTMLVPQASVLAATTSRGSFCTALPTLTSKIQAHIPKRQDVRDTRVGNMTTRKGDHVEWRMTKLDDHRSIFADNRAQIYAKFESLATTSDEQSAVKTFEATVDAAVVAHQSAVDTAVASYQNDVNQILANRQSQIDAAFTNLADSTNTALANAQTACANGTDPASVRTQLRSDLKAVNAAFRAAMQPSSDVKGQIQDLQDTLISAIKSADSTYKSAVQSGRATLKAAFGK